MIFQLIINTHENLKEHELIHIFWIFGFFVIKTTSLLDYNGDYKPTIASLQITSL
jgi:hypothetical protein